VNQKLLAMMNDTEQALVRETTKEQLAKLDEDALIALHTRVRRARDKYSKNYRRQAAGQVVADSARGGASAKNQRTRAKAEVFEQVLADVSRQLAVVARRSAAELRTERLAAARASSGRSSAPARQAKPKPASAPAPKRNTRAQSKTPIDNKRTASTRATGARRQAKRDSR
jgi:hypothetical protein